MNNITLDEIADITEIIDFRDLYQCAWCKCLMVNGIGIKEEDEILDLSHGICLKCRREMEEENNFHKCNVHKISR